MRHLALFAAATSTAALIAAGSAAALWQPQPLDPAAADALVAPDAFAPAIELDILPQPAVTLRTRRLVAGFATRPHVEPRRATPTRREVTRRPLRGVPSRRLGSALGR